MSSEIRKLILKAIDEKGEDYVYPAELREEFDTCLYFTPDGAPACIIGHVLAYKGIEATYDIEGQSAYDVLRSCWPEPLPAAVLIAATQAQQTQDGGGTWADALETFDRTYAECGA